jgi:hypothetical protein
VVSLGAVPKVKATGNTAFCAQIAKEQCTHSTSTMSNSNVGTGKGGDVDSHIESGAPLPSFTTNIQLSTIAPAYGLQSTQQQPDYLDYDQKGRGVVSTMFTNSGISYLLGVTTGGVYGLQEGLRNTPSSRWKVKLNSVLNHCGRYGSQVGNMMGATAILYSLYEGLADTVSTLQV